MHTPNIETKSKSESTERLLRVRDLWNKSEKDQLEIGRLLYEEHKERLGVGGRGARDGFHEWLRETGIPKTSAYRRIAEYEIFIGERTEDDKYDKPVPIGTSLASPAPDAIEAIDTITDRLNSPDADDTDEFPDESPDDTSDTDEAPTKPTLPTKPTVPTEKSETVRWDKTRCGHDFYDVLSALQKAVRRQDKESALYWAWDLGSASPNHAARLWSRLHIIASEDIGIADSAACVLVNNLHARWKERQREGDSFLYYMHAVAYLAQTDKSRLIDNAICAFEGELKLGMKGMDLPIPDIADIEKLKLKIPDYALGKHTRRGKQMGRGQQFFFEEEAKLTSALKRPDDMFAARAKAALTEVESNEMNNTKVSA